MPFWDAAGRPHKTYKWSDARKLYTYGLEHFKMKDVFQEETFARVPVSRGTVLEGGGRSH